MVPKCLRSEVSWVRSVLTPFLVSLLQINGHHWILSGLIYVTGRVNESLDCCSNSWMLSLLWNSKFNVMNSWMVCCDSFLNIWRKTIKCMDVNKSRVWIFFLDPGKGISRLQRIETSDRPTIGLLRVGWLPPVALCLLSVYCLVASPRLWPAYQMHGRRETKDSGVFKW